MTRRRLMQSLVALLGPAIVATKARATPAQAIDAVPLSPSVLPSGIRSRVVDNINGLRMHVLESGFEGGNRPGVVLPELFLSDPDRVARFQREAQILAALNHPHIAAIYGLERQEGREGQESWVIG